MENQKISFPLKQLNIILDEIKPNTQYEISFLTNECSETLGKIYLEMIRRFTFQDGNILTIDVNRMADSVRKHFKSTPDLNLDKYYSEMDIYDFLNMLNDNPVCAEMNSKISEVIGKNGSFFAFQLQKKDKDLFDDFIYPDIPSAYKSINIDFTFSGHLFDSILHRKFDCIAEYAFPFSIFDNPGKLKELNQDNYHLTNEATVEVHVEPSDELIKNGIIINYSFNIKFDIMTGKLII
ncbi:MAG TPA: hypothetical protein VIK14_16930 [Ignavibacteria bacterium]